MAEEVEDISGESFQPRRIASTKVLGWLPRHSLPPVIHEGLDPSTLLLLLERLS